MHHSDAPLDLSHHLSIEVRRQKPNAMKQLWRLTQRKPNILSLGSGDPHFSLYPVKKIQFEVASTAEDIADPVDAWTKADTSKSATQWFTSARDEPSSLPIQRALPYTAGAGLPDAQRTVTELTQYYHSPPDHVSTLTLGNMDGVTKCFRLLGSPGDHFLADEFSFNALTNAPLSQGISWVPVRIDKGGLIPSDLERILSNWNDEIHGRRPHVLYSVPSGQNPTGCTLSLERRKQIYAIAHRYDLIIIEDDPYYFLQYTEPGCSSSKYTPSFLSMDIDGRVIRVDSFSKIMMPGMRLGWLSSNAVFQQHLITMIDSSTQHPHAFGQIFITEMLSASGWRLSGFDRWTRGLRNEYQRRRDFFLDIFQKEVAHTGFASADPPEAGMFVWIDIHIQQHPRYRCDIRDKDASFTRTNVRELMDELFERLLDGGLVVMPASVFATPASPSALSLLDTENPIEDRINFVRTTFAGDEATMQPALVILGRVLKEFFSKLE